LAINFEWGESGLASQSGTGVTVSAEGQSVNTGDLLIACVALEGPTDPGTIVAPDGWAVLNTSQLNLNSNIPVTSVIFYKIANAGDSSGNYAFSWTNSAQCSWTLVDYSGVDPNNPIPGFGYDTSGGWSSQTQAPALDGSAGDTLVNIYVTKGGSGAYHADESESVRANTFSYSSTWPEIAVADRTLTSSGSTGSDELTEQYATIGQRGFSLLLNCNPVCFMPGTMIQTPNGEVAIESITRGDVVTTVDGRSARVAWVGRQTVCMHFADPLRVLPIRIKANALGEKLPSRDLLLSPDHAILVEGILAHAGALVNGHSIVRETEVPLIFTYYNLELDEHSLILAENLPAETFVDNVERQAFDNWSEHEVLFPDGKSVAEMEYPRAKSHRQVPRSVRELLDNRGMRLYPMSSKSAA